MKEANPSAAIAVGPEAAMADSAGHHRLATMQRRTVLIFVASFTCVGFFFAGLGYFATLAELEKQNPPDLSTSPLSSSSSSPTSSLSSLGLPPPNLLGPGQGGYSPTLAAIDQLLRESHCTDLYIDMGTDIGIEPRKLYEPLCYPRSSSVRMFSKVFGKKAIREKSVCTIGFEPNMRRTPRLAKVEERLKGKGARVKMLTATGISGHDGKATFYTSQKSGKEGQAGGLFPSRSMKGPLSHKAKVHGAGYPVTVLSLHSILGSVKAYGKVRNLLIKVDIEGSEYEALGNAAANKVLCSAANKTVLVVEEHPKVLPVGSGEAPPRQFVKSLLWMVSFSEGCSPKRMQNHDDTFPLDVTDKSNKACYMGAP